MGNILKRNHVFELELNLPKVRKWEVQLVISF